MAVFEFDVCLMVVLIDGSRGPTLVEHHIEVWKFDKTLG
jgi:hypothetical protein